MISGFLREHVDVLRDAAKTVEYHGKEPGTNKVQNDYGEQQARVLRTLAHLIETYYLPDDEVVTLKNGDTITWTTAELIEVD